MPCVFSAVLELFVSLSLVLEVTSKIISEILLIHFSNLLRKVMPTCALYALGKGISRWDIHKVVHNKFSLTLKSIHQAYGIVLST